MPKKTVEEMASCLLLKLGKETKPTQVCKRPAANVEEEQPTKVAKMGDVNKKATKAASKDDTLNFPGIEKQPPNRYKNMTIYTSATSSKWRVQVQGDKLDRAFSWKREDPEIVWGKVVSYVLEKSEARPVES